MRLPVRYCAICNQTFKLFLLCFLNKILAEEVDWSVADASLFQKCTQYFQLFPTIKEISSASNATESAVDSNLTNVTGQVAQPAAATSTPILNVSSGEEVAGNKFTTPIIMTTPVRPTPAFENYCTLFDLIYDQTLSAACLVLKEYRRNSDLTEQHCKSRCLTTPACKAFQYSTERDPNCVLFAYRAGEMSVDCQMVRSFDWKLYELKKGCRDQKCGRFIQVRRTLLSGCRNQDGGYHSPTQAQCELTCSENHWCLAYIFRVTKTAPSCQLYLETPDTSPTCTAVPDRSFPRNSKLMVKNCV